MENLQNPVTATTNFTPVVETVPQQVQTSTVSQTLPENTVAQALPTNQGRNKFLIGFLCLVAFLALGVGGAFAYMKYFPAPEVVLMRMMATTGDIKTVESSGKVTMQIDVKDVVPATMGKEKSTSSIDFNGKFDVNDVNNPNAEFSLNFESDVSDVQGQGTLALGIDYKMIGKIVYVSLNQLKFPKVPQIEASGFDPSVFVNKWLKIDIKDATTTSKELTKEQTRKMNELFKESKMFKIVATLPSEELDGMATFHYKFAIDKEEVKKFAKGAGEITDNKPLNGDELVNFNKFFDMIEMDGGEIWVGKQDFFLRKVMTSVSFDSTKAYKEVDDPKVSGKFDMNLTYKNINKPVVVEAPKDAQTIEELMSSVLGGEERVNRAPENFFMGEPVRVESTESAMLKEATESADLEMTEPKMDDNIQTTPDGE